jgi:hypothetical protein
MTTFSFSPPLIATTTIKHNRRQAAQKAREIERGESSGVEAQSGSGRLKNRAGDHFSRCGGGIVRPGTTEPRRRRPSPSRLNLSAVASPRCKSSRSGDLVLQPFLRAPGGEPGDFLFTGRLRRSTGIVQVRFTRSISAHTAPTVRCSASRREW